MRLHHLSLTAFGPYAGTEVVDFDALNDAGVFLLSGPMGAGKTSILDAICFALYGVVPGERGVKTLRSHHASLSARPEVVLEVTIRDRRYRIRRSPEWQRPKRRGEGATREQASASLVELLDGTERLISSRAAEVGHELGAALQMSSEQFMQVVLLPQGGFQRFLRATSDERQTVLERLFGTARFGRIEEWVREHARGLAHAADSGERRASELVGTIAHRAGAAVPPELDPGGQPQRAAALSTWADGLLIEARSSYDRACAADRAADHRLVEAERSQRLEERRAALLDRRRRARRELEELATEAATQETLRAAVDAHERAVVVTALLGPLDTAEAQQRDAVRRLEDALLEAGRLPVDLRPADWVAAAGLRDTPGSPPGEGDEREPELWEGHLRSLTDRLCGLRRLLPHEGHLAEVRLRLDRAETEGAALGRRMAEAETRAQRLPARRDALLADRGAAQTGAVALAESLQARDAAEERHRAAAELTAALLLHEELLERSRAARDRAGSAREVHLGLVEQRLRGMAAELAAQLEPERPCQVCGSTVHPAPAAPAADAVTEERQRLALETYERLRASSDRLCEGVCESTRHVDGLRTAAAGLTEAAAAAEAATSRAAVDLARAAAERLPLLEGELDALHQEGDHLTALLEELREQHRVRDLEVAALHSREQAITAELLTVLGDPQTSVARSLEGIEAATTVVREVGEALTCRAQAADRLREAARQADGTARDQGFDSADSARSALIGDDGLRRARDQVERHEARRRLARAALAEVDAEAEAAAVDLGEGTGDVGLATARRAVEEARAGARRCHQEVVEAAAVLAALEELVSELDVALSAWEPARAAHRTASTLSELVRGRGADNQLQMRLSSYVLATRLDQVLDAANARLAAMRECRYTLRRTGEVHGNRRAGLGLEVLDEWTGEARGTGTLSGGETFVLSLALALGLADVVTQESGGLRVDTLFIDEGFGMLDQETLDDVMDRIDALRAGGRTVGVVSHVTELRARIPVQLQVTGGRGGSTVSLCTLVA